LERVRKRPHRSHRGKEICTAALLLALGTTLGAGSAWGHGHGNGSSGTRGNGHAHSARPHTGAAHGHKHGFGALSAAVIGGGHGHGHLHASGHGHRFGNLGSAAHGHSHGLAGGAVHVGAVHGHGHGHAGGLPPGQAKKLLSGTLSTAGISSGGCGGQCKHAAKHGASITASRTPLTSTVGTSPNGGASAGAAGASLPGASNLTTVLASPSPTAAAIPASIRALASVTSTASLIGTTPGGLLLTPGSPVLTLRSGTGSAATHSGHSTHASKRPHPSFVLAPLEAAQTVIDHFINVVPTAVWIGLAVALGFAALAGGSAIRQGRRARRQAGQFAAISAAALTDALTGVLNRRGFTEAVERELARARRYRRAFVFAYVDVRGLKAVNDTEGHLAGDQLLKSVATLLRDSARADDVVGRIGGDELGLLLVEQTREGAEAVIRRIVSQLPATRARIGLRAPWDLTIGTAAYPGDGNSFDELLAAADRRLYEQRGIALR
jgi:diguanylate cyclase (GGDEF)-like protein